MRPKRATALMMMLSVSLAPLAWGQATKPAATQKIATPAEAMASKVDVWGEYALKMPGGPTYEFFAKLLPPLRYVDARFHFYPINLSAPEGLVKGRVISNGSQINAHGNQPNWRGEDGIPICICVGNESEPFGKDLARLDGPRFDQGYLPIVQMKYRHDDQVYLEEVFASTDEKLAEHGVMFARFTMLEGNEGKVEARIDAGPEMLWASNAERDNQSPPPKEMEKGVVRGFVSATAKVAVSADEEHPEGGPTSPALVCFDDKWLWNRARSTLLARLAKGESVTLAVLTKPFENSPLPAQLDSAMYFSQREQCAKTWNSLLAGGMNVKTPEAVLNNAWRSTLIANYMMMHGDEMRYSAGNQYARLYIGEGSDATRAAALWGHTADAERLMVPLFVFTRKGLEFHQAAFKLQMLAQIYGLTKDKQWLEAHRKLWEKEINIILAGREKETGMLPREKYCGDIDTRVYSLNSNANCWRALRDMSVVLEDIGQKDRAAELASTASEYRKVILAAIEKAKRRDVSPPFLPLALSGEEEVHDPIFATRIGGYWDLMINYILGSGVFAYNSQTADEVTKYLQTKGGLCMGMTRVTYGKGFWLPVPKINDLYGTRYALLLQERDEPDRALVSFYGKLAQGLTRDTFVDGEASSMGALDQYGRQFYLPPNSAGNANFLQQLRYLLVQDYDLDDDGKIETLRLAFATPRAWLEDGKTIEVTKAPSAFGEVSFAIKSEIAKGEVTADVDLPARAAKSALLRFRLPGGAKIGEASAGGKALKVNGETVDLSGLTGHVKVIAKVGK